MKTESGVNTESGLPNAAKFMKEVLRGSSYSVATAIADIVDNSIEARAEQVWVEFDFERLEILVMDAGIGMSDATHRESMKIASETREYHSEDLGKYGTGMKAAALSLARRLIVATRAAVEAPITVRCLDLDHIEATNDWGQLTLVMHPSDLPQKAMDHFKANPTGTVVVLQALDRLGYKEGSENISLLSELKDQISILEDHLATVFHKQISGQIENQPPLELQINGNLVEPWDPFMRSETTIKLFDKVFSVNGHPVVLKGYILPSEVEFSSKQAFRKASGLLKWLDSQGFYVYRNGRLIKWGGWLGMRAKDPHIGLARVELSFSSELDEVFQVNVAKNNLVLNRQIKLLFQPEIVELIKKAQVRYRNKTKPVTTGMLPTPASKVTSGVTRQITGKSLALLIEQVARNTGTTTELSKIKLVFAQEAPEIARLIGWDDE